MAVAASLNLGALTPSIAAGLFVLALVPRLALLALNTQGLEVWEYETLAENVARGVGYVIPRFGHIAFAFGDGNLYSFLAASVYVVFGPHPWIMAIVQAILSSLAAPVIYAIGVRAFGDMRTAAVGATLASLHPGLLAYTTKLHPLGIDVLLMALMILWIIRAGEARRGGIMAGLTLGVALMSRPTFFLAGLAGLFIRARGARTVLVPLATAMVIAVTLASPWIARNWMVLGRPMLSSTSLEDVWKGNNPIASGSSYLANGQDVFSAAPARLRARFAQSDELALNDVFAEEIVEFVRDRPAEFASLVGRKFLYFWWLPPQAGVLYPRAWVAPYELYAVLVYTFALVGVVRIIRTGTPDERRLLGVLAAIGVSLAVIHALAYVEGRHRWGIEPLFLLLSAYGLFVTVARASGSWRRLAPGVIRNRAG
jgi:hypothetical protein